MRPLDTASDPSRSGLPGIQPGDPTAGIGGMAIGALTEQFQKGVQGPGAMLGGGGDDEEGGGTGDMVGMAMKVAPLLL
jgi:hypothetical protein